MNKFEKPELIIILFENDLDTDDDLIGNSGEGWGGDLGGGTDIQTP